MNYQALIQERANLIAEARDIFNKAQGENRSLTTAEAERDDAINARLTAINADIQRLERQRENERSVAPMQDANALAAHGARVSGMRDRAEDDPKRKFADIGDFAKSVKAASAPGGYVDERLRIGAAPTGYHQEAGSTEGYMVPPAMREDIWKLVFQDDDLLAMVNPEPTSQNEVKLLMDETTPWGATGIQAYWRSEGQQMNASKVATTPASVVLNELYAFVTATDELMRDAPRLNNRLTNGSAAAINWKINEALMTGNGVGKPLGWMASTALITVAKENAQSAGTVNAQNVTKMYSRCINPGRARWLVSQDVMPQLMTMTLGNQPIWTPPASGLVNAPGGFLLGRPVQFNDHCETLGVKGDVQLVNPDGYYAATRDSGPQFASSIHLLFDFNMEAFRWVFRFAGQPYMKAPLAPPKNAATRSHFLTLEARS